MSEKILIPNSGLVSLTYLAEMTGINVYTLTQSLTDYGVPFVKLGKLRRDWYVNLRKLDAVSFGEEGGRK